MNFTVYMVWAVVVNFINSLKYPTFGGWFFFHIFIGKTSKIKVSVFGWVSTKMKKKLWILGVFFLVQNRVKIRFYDVIVKGRVALSTNCV